MVKHSILLLLSSVFFLTVVVCNPTGGEDDDGGAGINLPPPPYQEFPRWSPDGKTILYYHSGLQLYDPSNDLSIHDRDSTGIWAMDPNGNNQRKILTAGYADWSPDGEWIVYVAGAQIFKVRFNGTSIDTSTIEQLTFEGRNFFPDWSPDGEWIAYGQSICQESKQCGIWIYNLKSEKELHVALYGRYPAWHPFNSTFLYQTRVITMNGEAIGDSLWFHDVSKRNNQPLAYLSGNNRYPTYSPDGKTITFSSNVQIWKMSATGSELSQLTFGERGTMPDWSPDGKQIIYSGPDGEIWVMNADGTNQKSLTTRPEGSIN